MSLTPYPLALLDLMEDEETSAQSPPLGIAQRVGAKASTFNIPAHRLLRALIFYAPSPEAMAGEFLVELSKCGNQDLERLSREVQGGTYQLGPGDWAALVHRYLKEPGHDITSLTKLGSHYLTHLVVAFRNPRGKKTPQDTIHATPNPRRIEEIKELLEKATIHRSQSALRDFISLRDGDRCPLTDASFVPPLSVIPRCAHIIPFSIHSKTQTHSAIETFTGRILTVELVQRFINNPNNALNLQNDAHDSMDKHLSWGIEARSSDNQWKYFYRVVRKDLIAPYIKLKDGDEIRFGRGPGGTQISLPDPTICNLHLAIARVSDACGASEAFDQFDDDDYDEGCQVPTYFGSPFISDEVLMDRLEARLEVTAF